jgi:cellulose synthase operon protein C
MGKSITDKYEQILALDPRSLVFPELAKTLIDQGEPGRAAEVCRRSLEHNPNSLAGWLQLGRASVRLKRQPEAMDCFERVISLDPGKPFAYLRVAEALMEFGPARPALKILEKAAALNPADGRLKGWLERAQTEAEASPQSPQDQIPGGAEPPVGEPPPSDAVAVPRPVSRELEQLVLSPDASRPAGAPPPIPRGPPPEGGPIEGTEPLHAAISKTVALQIAKEFEERLREAHRTKATARPVWRRYWFVLALGSACALAGLVAIGGSWLYRRRFNQQHAAEFLGRIQDGLLLDTYGALLGASHQLDELQEIDPRPPLPKALEAQVSAALYRQYGGSEDLKTRAEAALAQSAGSRGSPGSEEEPAWVARLLLAPDPAAEGNALLALPEAKAGPWVHFLAGNLLLARGDAQAALKRYQSALKLAPNHVPALLAVGDYYLKSGDASKAAEFFALAHQTSPMSVGAAVGQAEADLSLNRPLEDDEKSLQSLDRQGPEAIPVAWRLRLDLAAARVLAGEGKLDEATHRLEEGLGQHADRLTDYAGALAEIFEDAGRYAEAERQAWRALSRSPKDLVSLERYGRILMARRRFRELLTRVVAPPGEDARPIHELRAEAQYGLGNCAAARSEIEATRRAEKIPAKSAILLALCEARAGRASEAREAIQKIASLPHPPAEAFVALGTLDLQAGAPASAATQFRKAVELAPKDFEAHCSLGRSLVAAGRDSAEGRTELLEALRLNQQHQEAALALGLLELDQGRAAEARPYLETAVSERPGDAASNLALARDLAALGQVSDAVRRAEQAVRAAPKDARTHYWLGKIQLAAGEHRAALREFKLARQLDHKDPQIGAALASVERKSGRARH